MMRVLSTVLAAATALAACGGDSAQDDGIDDSDDTTDGPSTMAVTGTATEHVVTDPGVADRPADFTNQDIFSLTATPTGFQRYVATGMPDGTFTVPVRAGATEWYIGRNDTSHPVFMVGAAATLDFSNSIFGRPDALTTTTVIPVTMNVTGLAPWKTGNDLEIVSANAGVLVDGPQSQFATAMVGNQTAITNQMFNWPKRPLPDAAKADVVQVVQIAVDATLPIHWKHITKAGSATDVTLTPGTPGAITVALADVAQSAPLALSWKRSQYEAMLAQAGPGVVDAFQNQLLSVRALPNAMTAGTYSDAAPDLARVVQPADATDFTISLAWGNPFATAGVPWDEYVVMRYRFVVPLLLEGTTTAATLAPGCASVRPAAALRTDGTIAPVISMPKDVTIGTGLAPIVSWSAPDLGTATNYQIEVRSLTASGAFSVLDLATVLVTPGTTTTVQIPPGILVAGTTYVVNVEAIASPGADFSRAPFLGVLPIDVCETTTAPFLAAD